MIALFDRANVKVPYSGFSSVFLPPPLPTETLIVESLMLHTINFKPEI